MDATESRALDRGWNCRLTVVGRKSGQPRKVTIWYVCKDGVVYLTGGKENPQWCRNLRANGDVQVELRGRRFRGRAKLIDEPDEAAAIRQRFVQKYLLARLSRVFGGYSASVAVVVELLGPDPEAD